MIKYTLKKKVQDGLTTLRKTGVWGFNLYARMINSMTHAQYVALNSYYAGSAYYTKLPAEHIPVNGVLIPAGLFDIEITTVKGARHAIFPY